MCGPGADPPAPGVTSFPAPWRCPPLSSHEHIDVEFAHDDDVKNEHGGDVEVESVHMVLTMAELKQPLFSRNGTAHCSPRSPTSLLERPRVFPVSGVPKP